MEEKEIFKILQLKEGHTISINCTPVDLVIPIVATMQNSEEFRAVILTAVDAFKDGLLEGVFYDVNVKKKYKTYGDA